MTDSVGRCVDCGAFVSKKRCPECAMTAHRRHVRDSARRRRGSSGVYLCKVCGKPILDRGAKGNRQYHPECRSEKQRREAEKQIRRGQGRKDEGRRLDATIRRLKIKKEIFNVCDLQQAPPDKMVRMIETMER